MANVTTTNPMVFDTVADAAWSGRVTRWEWHPNAANDTIEIQDSDGSILFKTKAPVGAPNDEAEGVINVAEGTPKPVTGIYVKSIAGTLYVHKHKVI